MISDQIDESVSQDDIERAIRKSLVDEVSRHAILNDEKKSYLYQRLKTKITAVKTYGQF